MTLIEEADQAGGLGDRATEAEQALRVGNPQLELVGVRREADGLAKRVVQMVGTDAGDPREVPQQHPLGVVLVEELPGSTDRERLAACFSGRRTRDAMTAGQAAQKLDERAFLAQLES